MSDHNQSGDEDEAYVGQAEGDLGDGQEVADLAGDDVGECSALTLGILFSFGSHTLLAALGSLARAIAVLLQMMGMKVIWRRIL